MEAQKEWGREYTQPKASGTLGKFAQRLPKSLHAKLVRRAKQEGVSLNTLVLTSLAEGIEKREGAQGGKGYTRLSYKSPSRPACLLTAQIGSPGVQVPLRIGIKQALHDLQGTISSALPSRTFFGQYGSATNCRAMPIRSALPSFKIDSATSGRLMRPTAMTGTETRFFIASAKLTKVPILARLVGEAFRPIGRPIETSKTFPPAFSSSKAKI